MRNGVLALLALAAAALVALVVLGATRSSGDVYSLGVGAFTPVAVLHHGDTACQTGVRVPDGASFDRVAVSLGTFKRPGRPVALEIRAAGGRVVAHGRLAGGYPDFARRPRELIPTGRTTLRGPVSVCLRNPGTGRVAVYGGAQYASPATVMTIDGKPAPADMSLAFTRANPPSVLASVPDMLQRATVFKAGVISRPLLAVLCLLAFLGVPLGLAYGLRAAGLADRDGA